MFSVLPPHVYCFHFLHIYFIIGDRYLDFFSKILKFKLISMKCRDFVMPLLQEWAELCGPVLSARIIVKLN